MSTPRVTLKAKRAEILKRYRHPWVFSQGLGKRPRLEAGALVRVVSQDGRPLGCAFYHPDNSISLRMISFESMDFSAEDWQTRLAQAQNLRRRVMPPDCKAYRLIHGENDGFPGLAVDRYGDLLCIQINSAGMERLKPDLVSWLLEITGARSVFERSEGHARKQEGLPSAVGFLHGECALPLTIEEHGIVYEVDPRTGHKTGFYLDQRAQRAWLKGLVKNRHVLDLCCYSGGFSLAALAGGAARVWSVDSSAPALDLLARNLARNGLPAARQTSHKADLFEFLRSDPQPEWDVVVLDPPSLAKNTRAEAKALKAYRQLNRDAARWIKPGGLLLSFSCSGVVSAESFRQSVFLGLRDAGREARLLESFGAGPDHPVHLHFPEGAYLKGLALYIA